MNTENMKQQQEQPAQQKPQKPHWTTLEWGTYDECKFRPLRWIEFMDSIPEETVAYLLLYSRGVVDRGPVTLPEWIAIRRNDDPTPESAIWDEGEDTVPPSDSVDWSGFEEIVLERWPDIESECEVLTLAPHVARVVGCTETEAENALYATQVPRCDVMAAIRHLKTKLGR